MTDAHHTALVESVPGYWEVARPLQDTSWWRQRRERLTTR